MSQVERADDAGRDVYPSRCRKIYHTKRLCRGTLLDKSIPLAVAESRGYEACRHCENDPV